jgi:hypothetical protein
MKTKTPATFRMIRPNHFEVERNGKRVGSLSQIPPNSLINAGRWRYYPEGAGPVPLFRTLDEAKDAI